MGYASLEECLIDLEKNGHLIRIREEVDPYLELATIHLRIQEAGGPALLFENVKGTNFRCASNIFGTLERSKFIFRDTLEAIKKLIALKQNPAEFFQHPFQYLGLVKHAIHSVPLRNPVQKPVLFQEIQLSDLPQIHHWKNDGGAFVTLPQVYSEDVMNPGVGQSNLGMYRIQLSGNEYIQNEEVGLHYQLHRGIGVHQSKAIKSGKPFRVCCFVGGPPAHSVAAVMPLPEGMSELNFAGLLAARRFRYAYRDGYSVSTDADFVITGTVEPHTLKPEGPFGDHLGYYSLKHLFPVLKVHKVYAKKNAIWPFTVVGRPPQEDTRFGELIHELTGRAIPNEIPGLKEVHAVDAAGVHPLLLAIGSERYTPYAQTKQPAELLTIANHILGTGQLSLAKFLFITCDDQHEITTKDIPSFFRFMLERMDLSRDIHFYTHTTIDTLDYSGEGLNSGSKVVFAAYGEPIRTLRDSVPDSLKHEACKMVMPGIMAVQMNPFQTYSNIKKEILELNERFTSSIDSLKGIPFIILCDDAVELSRNLNNFLWMTFTRCNPSHDIHGLNENILYKHWGCSNLMIDARKKPHHAPELIMDPAVLERTNRFFKKGGPLQNWDR